MNTTNLNFNDISLLIAVALIMIVLIIAAIVLLKGEIFVGERPYVYLFPLLSKKMEYPSIRRILFFTCAVLVILVGISEKANLIGCIIAFLILSWLLYLLFHSFITLLGFAAEMKKTTWITLFVIPVFSTVAILLSNSIVGFKYVHFLYLACEMLAAISLIGTYRLMFNAATNKNNSLDRNSTSNGNNVLLAEIYLIFVQIVIFWVMFAGFVMMGIPVINSAEEEVKDMLDIFYYVIMTYTTVGYGDLQPAGNLGKILSCVISMTGFVTSVCVIGLLVGNMSDITSANNKNVQEDSLPNNTTDTNCGDLNQ